MKLVSRFALAAALVVGGGAVALTAPADAKKKEEPAKPTIQLSKEERAALLPLQTAVTAKDWAAAQAALPAAEAGATTGEAKRYLGYMILQLGLGVNDEAMQARAVDTIIASGTVPAADLPALYQNQAALALRVKPVNPQKAEAAFTRLSELTPNDPEVLVNLAKVKSDLHKPLEALPLMDRAIAAKKAAGQPVDASWYRYALKIAYDGKRSPEALKITRDLITAYPTKENWRDSLLIYRDVTNLDKSSNIDLLRLMRATKSLTGERDWFELAEALDNGGLPGESKAVLEEGSTLRMVDLNKPAFRDLMRTTSGRIAADRAGLSAAESKANSSATGLLALNTGDAYLGYGDYAKAASLYRAALTKGSVDTNLVNLHLGMALAQSGDRAGAEAAFRAVTGPRSDIASYWLVYLTQRGA
jgi:tetratricopeptide (TPR) repeat protein